MGGRPLSRNHRGTKVDETPGSLVWVRRRNGSWWPGRILGIDELPESCSISPKEGTPVKLLGREDGSMDWYNLEKSKRIKAFRCGEHDGCIDKARALDAVQSTRVKERKYAKREEAILHALEIERALQSGGREILNGKFNDGAKLKEPESALEFEGDLNTVEVKIVQKESWSAQSESAESKTKEHLQVSSSFREASSNIISGVDFGSVEPLDDGFLDVPVFWEEVYAGDFLSGRASHKRRKEVLAESDGILDEHGSSNFVELPKHFNKRTSEKENSKYGLGSTGKKTSNKSHVESSLSETDTFGDDLYKPRTQKRSKKSAFSRDMSISHLPVLRCSSLYDVKVEVKTTYHGPRVPLVSVISQLNGRAVVGHPIAVEFVEDAWIKNVDMLHKRMQLKKSGETVHNNYQKSETLIYDRSKGSENRRQGILMRKTRRLSSITDNEDEDPLKTSRTVACVPLSQVFRRINGELATP
ncbi:uncharacterized protein LOC144703647 [Wolffia australiana]